MNVTPTIRCFERSFDWKETRTAKVTSSEWFAAQKPRIKNRTLSTRIESIMTLLLRSLSRPEKLSDVLCAERSSLNLKHLHPQQK